MERISGCARTLTHRVLDRRRRWHCELIGGVSDRQDRVPGWDQHRLSRASVLLVGSAGLGGEVAEGLVLKGVGTLHACDPDIVTTTNLNRQKFTPRDLYRNKAVCLCRNLSGRGFLGTHLIAHPCAMQDLDLVRLQPRPDLVVCGVDMTIPGSRLDVCRMCFEMGIPLIVSAVSTDADWGYVQIQKPGKACWACAMKPERHPPESEAAEKQCPGVPACIDILKVMAGQILTAVDSLVMDRVIDWNFRSFSLSRGEFGGAKWIERRRDCPVCGTPEVEERVRLSSQRLEAV